MNRGLTVRSVATIVAFVLLGVVSLVLLVPNIMLGDAPSSDSTPLVAAAIDASLLAPFAFLGGAVALVPAGYFRWRPVIWIATTLPILIGITEAVSLLLLFTWCDGHASRFGCHPV